MLPQTPQPRTVGRVIRNGRASAIDFSMFFARRCVFRSGTGKTAFSCLHPPVFRRFATLATRPAAAKCQAGRTLQSIITNILNMFNFFSISVKNGALRFWNS
ncbi:hypothetical protein [Allorhizobium undicola]|uniref:hypothetical protein n=1 Tax=Allorhizobium undicola TaxID=78527 RepID=UPI0004836DD1|nr:hypothetical protein [Allorhizobium undicola]